jgi:putative endopeptidase
MAKPCSPRDDLDCYYNSTWKKNVGSPKYIQTKNKVSNFSLIQEDINNELCSFVLEHNNDSLPQFNTLRESYGRRLHADTVTNLIDRIVCINTLTQFISLVKQLTLCNIPILFSQDVSSHFTAPKEYVMHLSEIPLVMEKLSYNNDDKIFKYMDLLSQLYSYIYVSYFGSRIDFAKIVVTFEIVVSRYLIDLESVNDPNIVCNSLPKDQFLHKFDSCGLWKEIIPSHATIISYDNEKYFTVLPRFLKDKYLDMLKARAVMTVILRFGVYMHCDMIIYKIKDKTYDPVTRFIMVFYNAFGNYLERHYDEKHLTSRKKEIIQEIFDGIVHECINSLKYGNMFTQKTIERAIKKIDSMMLTIGHQEYYVDPHLIPELSDDFYSNLMTIDTFYNLQAHRMIGQDVNRKFVSVNNTMFSFVINAYYNTHLNSMYIPTAILNDVYCNADESPLYNYGAIGCIIGHEIVHSLDNNGSEYNEDGSLENWWVDEDRHQYEIEINKVKDHYASLQINGININPNASIGEDIADIGGLKLCLLAYIKKYGNDNLEYFFQRWAEAFRSVSSDILIIKQINSDVHSPGIIRVNAPFSHINEYYQVFNVVAGDHNYLPPHKRSQIMDTGNSHI